MIRFINVSLMRGTKQLLENADLTLNPREKIGLVGSNGAGKSSIFSLLRKDLHVDTGDIDFPQQWRIAYVAQETPALDRTAIEYAIDGDIHLRQLEQSLAELEKQPATTEVGTKIAELHSALADADAYTVRSRAEQLLIGLGFTQDQFEHAVSSFSGGWRMRLNLAQALMCPSDLLLLDEPTNHLDLDAIIWLEDWLKRYQGTLIVISHDRDFLDGIVNEIVHVDQKHLVRYSGNYSDYERQRAERLVLAQQAIEKQTKQRAHLQSFIDRFKAKATKAKQAQSRMKMLSRLEEIAPLQAAAEFSFEFREPLSEPNPLLVMENVSVGYPGDNGQDHIVLNNINFSLQSKQRIGLLGINGAGKSTFIKTIAGTLTPLHGVCRFGKGLTIGYFAQHQLEMLRHDESPLWHLMHIAPDVREQELRNFLGSFNFHGEMATSSIEPFSGGEKARLALALIVWQRPNLLLLDEPTNHLDLETREALTLALAQFEGTVVLVSHDRHLLKATADQFYIVANGHLTAFDGDLDDYRNWLYETRLNLKQESAQTNKTASVNDNIKESSNPADRKEQKRLEAQERQRIGALRKPIEKKIGQLETKIEKLQEQKTILEQRLSDSGIYDSHRKEELKQLIADQASCNKELEQLENEWLEQQEQLEQISTSSTSA